MPLEDVAAPHVRRPRCGSGCGARCSTRSSTAASTTCPPPTCGRARAAWPARATARASEVMGAIEGGYQALVDALADADPRARRRGPHLDPVRFVPSPSGRAIGVVLDARLPPHDTVVTTQLRPQPRALLAPRARSARSGRTRCRYLGIVCLVARVARSVSPYYALNITDRRMPLTSVVETTHVVDPEARRRARWSTCRSTSTRTRPSSSGPRREIRSEYLGHVQTMFPAFRRGRRHRRAGRPRPRRRAGPPGRRASRAGPVRRRPAWPSPRRRSVYPEIVNGQAILGVAERVADGAGCPSARLPAPLGSGMTMNTSRRSAP